MCISIFTVLPEDVWFQIFSNWLRQNEVEKVITLHTDPATNKIISQGVHARMVNSPLIRDGCACYTWKDVKSQPIVFDCSKSRSVRDDPILPFIKVTRITTLTIQDCLHTLKYIANTVDTMRFTFVIGVDPDESSDDFNNMRWECLKISARLALLEASYSL